MSWPGLPLGSANERDLHRGRLIVIKSCSEGASVGFRSTIQVGDLVRRLDTGETFMVESDQVVHQFYGGNIWDDDLWRWQGDFPRAPECAL